MLSGILGACMYPYANTGIEDRQFGGGGGEHVPYVYGESYMIKDMHKVIPNENKLI